MSHMQQIFRVGKKKKNNNNKQILKERERKVESNRFNAKRVVGEGAFKQTTIKNIKKNCVVLVYVCVFGVQKRAFSLIYTGIYIRYIYRIQMSL